MSDGLNNITVLIAGRPFPLKLKDGDEAVIRRLVKEVNDKIALFQNTYPRKDRQDWLAMALLTYAVDLHKTQQVATAATAQLDSDAEDFDAPPLADRLSHLDALLASALDNAC